MKKIQQKTGWLEFYREITINGEIVKLVCFRKMKDDSVEYKTDTNELYHREFNSFRYIKGGVNA